MSADRDEEGPASHLEAVARQVDALGDEVFSAVEAIRDVAIQGLDLPEPRRTNPDLVRLCRELIADESHTIVGAGLVVEPGVLADRPYWMAWWQADPRTGKPRPLATETNPKAVGFRDYTLLPWFATPRRTRERALTGPYVDYLCTDQYTMTFTQPILAGERFLGVVGADVLVSRVEAFLLKALGDCPEECAVVNTWGRVVTSSTPDWVTGDLMRPNGTSGRKDAPLWSADRWSVVPCASLPLLVVSPGG